MFHYIATHLLLLAHFADVDLEWRIDIINEGNVSNYKQSIDQSIKTGL